MAAALEQLWLRPAEEWAARKPAALSLGHCSWPKAVWLQPQIPQRHGAGVRAAELSAHARTSAHSGEVTTAWTMMLGLTLGVRGHLSTREGPKLSCELCVSSSFILPTWKYERNVCGHVMLAGGWWVPTPAVIYLQKVVAARQMADLQLAGEPHPRHCQASAGQPVQDGALVAIEVGLAGVKNWLY